MNHNCEICRGRGTIRLSVHRPLDITALKSSAVAPAEIIPSRDFPCPECSDVVPITKVHAEQLETLADSRYEGDPSFMEHVRESLAFDLAAHLLRHGYIYFERRPTNRLNYQFAMRATIGVVTKKQADSLEERIAARQIELAQEVVTEAKAQIDNWGSDYGHTDILKRDARQQVDDAMKVVLKRRAGWKPLTLGKAP